MNGILLQVDVSLRDPRIKLELQMIVSLKLL